MKIVEPLLGVLACALAGVAVFSGGAFSATALLALRSLALLGLLLFATGWATGMFGLPSRWLLGLLALYVFLALLSTMGSPYPYGSLQAWLNLVVYAGAFAMASVLSAQDRRLVLWLLIGCAGVLGFYGLVQGMGMQAGLGQARLSGFYYNSNHYSGLLTLIIPVVIGAAWAVQGVPRMLLGLLAMVLFLNLTLTFAWGLVFVLLVLLVWWRRWFGGVLGLGLVGLLLVLFSPQLGSGNLKHRLDELLYRWTGNSLVSRVHLARASSQIALEHPWTGVGPGNYGYAFNRYRPAVIENDAQEILHRRIEYAHNDYLQVASETGLPSLLAWLGFWVLAVSLRFNARQGPQETRLYMGVQAGLIALLLHGLSDGNLTYVPANALLAYLLAGVLVGASKSLTSIRSPVLQGDMVWQDQQVTRVG